MPMGGANKNVGLKEAGSMSFANRILQGTLLRVPLLYFARVVGMTVAMGIFALPALAQTDDAGAAEARRLGFNNKAWSGDFDGMLERRLVRIAVPYGRT